MENLKFRKEKNSGITLIALIITIVVLLILAGVTISAISGNESAMEKATEAREKNEQGAELDAIKLAVINSVTSGMDGLVDTTALKSGLTGLIQENPEDVITGDSPWMVTSPSGRVYEINKNSTVNELTGLVLTPKSLTLTIEGDTYEEKTINARLIDIEGTLTWSDSTDKIDITPSADGFSATIKAKKNGTETVTVNCSNGDTATCTVTVTDKKPLAVDTLIINNNFSPYVKYTDANGNVITCRVLYNDNQHGLQIISNSYVCVVQLEQSLYDNALEYLNNYAENYINNDLAFDARCIGSLANVSNNSFEDKNNQSGYTSGTSTNYLEDYNIMGDLNIRKIYTRYWLASKYTWGNNQYVVRVIDQSRECQYTRNIRFTYY